LYRLWLAGLLRDGQLGIWLGWQLARLLVWLLRRRLARWVGPTTQTFRLTFRLSSLTSCPSWFRKVVATQQESATAGRRRSLRNEDR
jgi:hypothetical protein